MGRGLAGSFEAPIASVVVGQRWAFWYLNGFLLRVHSDGRRPV